MYVDTEPMLTTWLAAVTSLRCVTELPATLETAVPLIEVGRIGGTDRDLVVDGSTVDITCWGSTRDTARKLALLVQDRMRFRLPGTNVAGGTVMSVNCVSGPTWLPYDNTKVRRFHGTYQLFTRHS